MRLTENKLRRIIRSVILEQVEESVVLEKRLPQERIKEALIRFNEHEMNVDSEDERPQRGFDKVLKIADKANQEGIDSLTDREAKTLYDYSSALTKHI